MASDGPHKGVMLCERPANLYSFDTPAFKPSCASALEPLGLNPVKKAHAQQSSPGISALQRMWVKEFQEMHKHSLQQEHDKVLDAQAKKQALAAFSAKLRTAILSGEGVSSDIWKAAALSESSRPSPGVAATENIKAQRQAATKDNTLLQEVDAFVEQICMEATASVPTPPDGVPGKPNVQEQPSVAPSKLSEVTAEPAATVSNSPATPAQKQVSRPGTSGSCKSKKPAGSSKPAWALSEGEHEAALEDEELALLDFAENLDFDSFVDKLDDAELQDTFKALQETEVGNQAGGDNKAWRKTFVRALNHAALKQIQSQQQQQQGQQGDAESVAGHSEVAASVVSRATHTSRARSEATAAKLAALAGRQEENASEGKWDSSSRVGDTDARAQSAASKLRAAEEILLDNPELKAVHSVASVRMLLTRSEQQLQQSTEASS